MPKYGTDYTKTALELKNPLEVRDLLLAWGKAHTEFQLAEEALQATIKGSTEDIVRNETAATLAKAHEAVREAVGRAGSYQDIAEGLYALQQSRTSINYDAAKVRTEMPKFAEAVIIEGVDTTKMNGLIKGGLVTDAEVERVIIRTDLAPAYIIDVVEKPPEVASG